MLLTIQLCVRDGGQSGEKNGTIYLSRPLLIALISLTKWRWVVNLAVSENFHLRIKTIEMV